MHICIHVCGLHMYMHVTHVEAWGWLWVSFFCVPLSFLKGIAHRTWWLSLPLDWMTSSPTRVSLSLTLQYWGYRPPQMHAHAVTPCFYVGVEDPTLDSHACTASAVPVPTITMVVFKNNHWNTYCTFKCCQIVQWFTIIFMKPMVELRLKEDRINLKICQFGMYLLVQKIYLQSMTMHGFS